MTPDADLDLVLLDDSPSGTAAGDHGEVRPVRVVVSDAAVSTAFVRLESDSPEDERRAAVARARLLTAAPDSRGAAALDATVRSILEMDSRARHDIANQLMVLSGYLELLEEMVPEGEAREFLDGSLRAAELVNRHLAFTRSYRGFGTLSPAWQDLAALLPASVELPAEAAGVRVWADPLAPAALAGLLAARGEPGVRCRASVEPGPVGALLIALDDDGPALADRDLRLFFDYRQGEGQSGEPFLARHVLGATGIGLEATPSSDGGLRLRMAVPDGCALGGPIR
ncbi:hypothetical protein DSECCO2_345440 [anaerobic digester metagenome]